MKKPNTAISALILCVLASGCTLDQTGTTQPQWQRQQAVTQQLLRQPDIPEWHAQREKVAEALGDRVFDKDFDRVFGSLTVALSSTGARVATMEKQSGFISVTSARSLLPPDQIQQLAHQGAVEYCQYYKLAYDGIADTIWLQNASPNGSQASMTISLVKQSARQTKVKLRFAGANYPPMLEELYKVVWPSLDKQIFMDQGTD